MNHSRRQFLRSSSLASLAAGFPIFSRAGEDWLRISLQQYSFRPLLTAGEFTALEYPQFAVEETEIRALEYFNGFFMEKAGDEAWFADLRKRCDDLGVENQLILCKNDRAIDDADGAVRKAAADDYIPWLAAAQSLGCHSIRVDCRSAGEPAEVLKQATDGLHQLCEIAKRYGVDIIVEPHGNHSSNGKWLVDLMKAVDLENCGTLPDFGNFSKEYDRYQGVAETLPWARAVCAKVHHIEEDGSARDTDFTKMLQIVKDSGFSGYLGIEFEGNKNPLAGVLATKALIERTLAAMG